MKMSERIKKKLSEKKKKQKSIVHSNGNMKFQKKRENQVSNVEEAWRLNSTSLVIRKF